MTPLSSRTRLFVLALPLAALAAPQEGSAALVTREQLEQHVRFLASDELLGRRTGSEETMRAAAYLAEQLESYGVEPGGDDGTFLQAVPIRELSFEAVPELTVRTKAGEEITAVYGVDFEGLYGLPPSGELQVDLVREASDVPDTPDASTALFFDSSSHERRNWLGDKEGWGVVVRRGSSRPGRERTRPPRGARWMGDDAPAPMFSVRGPLCKRFEAGEIASLTLRADGVVEAMPAANVVGVLRGAGELADEGIVLSAHYDHIGSRERREDDEPDADLVFNGADDDASGCAAVLELARALAADGAPARTLVFLFATGEEIGLLGTKHYIDRPLVPLERTVCNLNFEMVGRPDDLVGGAGRLWLTGHERSNLLDAFAASGADVSPDLRPEQRFFRRSDNYAFARLGIVAQTLSSYDLHQDYHRVTDEADTLDYLHMEQAVRAAYRCALGLADGSIRPEWKPGGDPSQDE